jgi:hypothetical protein
MSLDGCIADPSGEGDRIVNDPEIDFNDFYSRFDHTAHRAQNIRRDAQDGRR